MFIVSSSPYAQAKYRKINPAISHAHLISRDVYTCYDVPKLGGLVIFSFAAELKNQIINSRNNIWMNIGKCYLNARDYT